MATQEKTVEFAMPVLASLTDNTLTSLTQITVYLPESSKTFRSVIARVTADATATATGNVTTRQLQCRLGAAGYTSNTNSNLYTGSGEDLFVEHKVDLTAHFTTNWSGTSMTFDAQVLFDGTATSIAWTNVCVVLYVTYSYDDTSATQIKTVRIPLNAPVAAMGTSKPAAVATIPDLDADLPEASKVYRNEFITVQGNIHRGAATDLTMTLQLDSTASITTGTFEGLSASDYFFRYVWDCSAVLDETNTMSFYVWASTADFNHVQAWLTVTYEFDATAANDVWVSLLLPSTGGLPGGSTSSDYLRVFADLFIPESGVVSKHLAYFGFWSQTGAVAGLNLRLGTGSFVAYTDVAAMLCGSNAAMVRNDAAFTLAQGANTLTADMYSTETTADLGGAFDGFFMVNYTCDKPADGHGAVTRTVRHSMEAPYSGASVIRDTIAAWAPVISPSEYFISNVGVELTFFADGAQGGFACQVDIERLSAEGGVSWDVAQAYSATADFETGIYVQCFDVTPFFKCWPGDLRTGYTPQFKRDVETARRWRAINVQQVAMWDSLDLLVTYHTQTWAAGGDVTGSAGGTVTIDLHDATTGEKLKTTSRSGNGSYSIPWYDPVRNLFTVAYEDATHSHRSATGPAV